ncbi:MAG TPA: TylF/MycF/NovP-related O-methyltransferase [Pyrinomonadaceae bacterium]|jgi:O-methyltransferase
MKMTTPHFPFDLFNNDRMPGIVGELIRATRHLSMFPPFPWGQWFYGRLLRDRWLTLPGDLIELGVGLGGMSIFLGSLVKETDKRVWSLDSFVGLPAPDPAKDNPYFKEGDYGPRADASDLFVRFQTAIDHFGLKETVRPIKGFFSITLGQLPVEQQFCLAHLDSDIYESILVSLEGVYDRVVEGGVIIIDDYFHHAQGAVRAAADFFNSRRIRPVYHVSFPYSVFMFKGEEAGQSQKRSLDGNIYSFEWLRRDTHFTRILRLSMEKAVRDGEDGKSFQNRSMLLELLRSRESHSSDIYVYWRAMESFWDSFADCEDAVRLPQLI